MSLSVPGAFVARAHPLYPSPRVAEIGEHCITSIVQVLHLESGRTRCTIVPEAGGRLHQLEVFYGREWLPLLHSPDDPEETQAAPTMSGSFAMVPWPNRIAAGVFGFDGERYQLPQNHHGHAIHGFGFDRAWLVEWSTADTCRLMLDFGDAWPFGGRAVQELRLQDDGIVQRIELHATERTFPGGAGWHPWFRGDVRRGVEARVCVLARHAYETENEIPTGRLVTVSGDSDLRDSPGLGDRRLDTCYRLIDPTMRIRWGDIELVMEQSPNIGHAVVYTPPEAFCVEPQTCSIDAFNLAAAGFDRSGMAVVTAARPLVATTTWHWHIGVSA
jgi:galactose mutarotase-like enzyme